MVILECFQDVGFGAKETDEREDTAADSFNFPEKILHVVLAGCIDLVIDLIDLLFDKSYQGIEGIYNIVAVGLLVSKSWSGTQGLT